MSKSLTTKLNFWLAISLRWELIWESKAASWACKRTKRSQTKSSHKLFQLLRSHCRTSMSGSIFLTVIWLHLGSLIFDTDEVISAPLSNPFYVHRLRYLNMKRAAAILQIGCRSLFKRRKLLNLINRSIYADSSSRNWIIQMRNLINDDSFISVGFTVEGFWSWGHFNWIGTARPKLPPVEISSEGRTLESK